MTKFQGSKEQQLALNTYIKLLRCANTVSAAATATFMDSLTVSQFGILEALYHLGPQSQKDLAAKILKSAGNITMVINNLVKNGLVTRCSCQSDRRLYSIELTDKGRDLISTIFPVHVEAVERRLAALSCEEQEQLGNLLKKLALGKAD